MSQPSLFVPPQTGTGLLRPTDAQTGADRPDPARLHPSLWRAHQLGHQHQAVVPSGFARLDAELPGGGWPTQALTELLLPHAGLGELRLLAPALAQVQEQGRHLLWFDPPARPCSWALAELGLDWQQLVVVRRRSVVAGATTHPATHGTPRRPPHHTPRTPDPGAGADVLWALEQALKSGHVGAVVAWLPMGVRPESLRRLQLAAQGHDGPVFLLREPQAQARPSVAALRLLLAPAGPDRLQLHILKRRGPPPQQPLQLALAAVLLPEQRARALRGVPVPGGAGLHPPPAPPAPPGPPAAGSGALAGPAGPRPAAPRPGVPEAGARPAHAGSV